VSDTTAIRVLLVDDQELVRSGFAMLLGAAAGIVVVGEAADGEDALDQLSSTEVDVVLMDIRMRGMGGVAATREITQRFPDGPRVLMLTTFDDDEALYAALDAGASGFLLKDCRAHELITAITAVHDGDSVIAPAMTRKMLDHLVSRPGGLTALTDPPPPSETTAPAPQDARLANLTPREVEVLTAVGRGRNNAQIAADLFLAEATVKTHLARIMHKLAVRDRVHLVLLAHSAGLVDLHQQD
jgi:DNA-binding NarL/FixJ family response regulator